MKKKFKSLKRLFAMLLAVTLCMTLSVDSWAAEMTGESTVSENEALQVPESEETETGWKYDPDAPFTERQGIPTEWVEAAGIMQPEAAGYLPTASTPMLTKDAFAGTSSKKGIQGTEVGQLADTYGTQHAFMNIEINRVFGSNTDVRYEFEGEIYWFIDMGGYVQAIREANRRGMTVSAAILLPNKNDEQGKVLIAPQAFANKGNNAKSPYYVADGNSKYVRAVMDYLAKLFSQADCHIDNWVVGNEVNMPNSWHFTGSTDPQYNVDLYTSEYLAVYNAVRKYTSTSRVSISLDHSWQHNDEGRGIAAKDFLNRFAATVASRQSNVDWCISYHLYPAILYEPDIWTVNAHLVPEDLNPKNEGAKFVDGYNLSIMTDYVKNTFGSQHRIMLTEQGFSDVMGQQVQAASLALSYYAAKYDPMVDCFIINNQNEGGNMNFNIDGKLAGDVFKKLDSDPSWVEAQTLPIIGVSSYSQIVPGYGRVVDKAKVEAFVTRLYEMCLKRQPEEAGLADWTGKLCNGQISGAVAARGFFLSDELKLRNITNEEYVELLYNVMMGRASDAAGKADWVYKLENGVGREGVYRGFAESAEFGNICNDYGIVRGSINVQNLEGRNKNPGLTTFVARLYTKALGREYEVDGLNDWCNRITSGQWTINDVSTKGFFNSPEFLAKNLSDDEYVKVLYRTFFDREYDQAGYDDWMNKLANGTSRNEVMLGFANSREFAQLKASYGLK